jgi:hypothetical protein
MQRGYRHVFSALEFRPDLTPKRMLELGMFCGKYLTDCRDEFPGSRDDREAAAPCSTPAKKRTQRCRDATCSIVLCWYRRGQASRLRKM